MVGGQRLSRFQRAAADEHGERAAERLFAGVEQVVAPRDGVTQGLLSGWQVASAVRQ